MGHLAGRRALLLAVVLAGGAVLGACSSSPKPVTHHHAQPTSTSTSPPTSPSTSSTSTVPTTSVETTCSTGLLGITAAPGGVAAGTSYIVFTLTNRGPTRCTLEGFPSLEFFGPSGASGAGAGPKLSITSMDGGEAPGLVTLASDGTAEFIVGCSTVASVDVAIPGTGEALAVPVTMTPCGGSVTVDAFDAPGSESP